MNDPAQARRLVLISVFGMLVISAYRGKLTSTTQGAGFLKRMWGVGVVAILLGLLADVAPQIAGPFAVLVVVGMLTNGGDQALQNLLGKVSDTGTATIAGGGGTTTLSDVPGNIPPAQPGAHP